MSRDGGTLGGVPRGLQLSSAFTRHFEKILSGYDSDDESTKAILVTDFQSFFSDSIRADADAHEGAQSIRILFKTVSLLEHQHERLLILQFLISIDFGDETTKMTEILSSVMNFEPKNEPVLFDRLEVILDYLTRCHHSAMKLILQPLRDKIWKIQPSGQRNPDDAVISILRLLVLFVRKFPVCLESLTDIISLTICQNVKSPNDAVLKVTMKLLKASLNAMKLDIPAIERTVLSQLTQLTAKSCVGAVLTIDHLSKRFPKIYTKYPFDGIPFFLLDSDDPTMVISGFALIPLILRTSPRQFGPEQYELFFTKMRRFSNADEPVRSRSFKCLGDFMFNPCYNSRPSTAFLQEFINALSSSLGNDEFVYGALALLSRQTEFLHQNFHFIFDQQFSSLMIRAFASLLARGPEFHSFLIAGVNYALFNPQAGAGNISRIFKGLRKLSIDQSLFSLNLILNYSQKLYHTDLSVREAAAEFLLHYLTRNYSRELVLELVSFIATERDKKLRGSIIERLPTSESDLFLFPILRTLVRDHQSTVRVESFRFLLSMLDDSDVVQFVVGFLREKLGDVEQSSGVTKSDIDCFLAAMRYQSVKSRGLVVPLAPFLASRLTHDEPPLCLCAYELLSLLLEHVTAHSISVPKLYEHLMHGLTPYSSKKELTPLLMLFVATMKHTSLKKSIYEEHYPLVCQIMMLGKLHPNEVSFDLLLTAFGIIGNVAPKVAKPKRSLNAYINDSPTPVPSEALLFGSIGVLFTTVLDIFANDKLVSMHPLALDTFVRMLTAYREIPEVLEGELVAKLRLLIRSESLTTVEVIMMSFEALFPVFGDSLGPLVQDIVRIIYEKWNEMNRILLLATTHLMLLYLRDHTTPHLKPLAAVTMGGLDNYPLTTAAAVFSTFATIEQNIAGISYILYPPMLTWLVAHAKETKYSADALGEFRRIVVFGGSDKFHGVIVRAMLQIIASNLSLHPPAVSILAVVAYQLRESFLVYMPVLRCVIDLDYYPDLSGVLRSIEHDVEAPESVSMHVLPKPIPRPQLTKMRSAVMTRSTIFQEFTFLPEITFDEDQWIVWKEAASAQMLLRSASPGITASGQLADRYPIYKETVFPIAVAQFVLDFPTMAIVQTVFSARVLPEPVLLLFMDALQILEFLGADLPVPDKIICTRAISLKLYHQALRAAERMFEAKVPITADLIKINLALDLPLAAAGAFRAAQEQKIVSNSVEFHELLGNWETCLEAYTAQLQRDPQNESLLQKRLECLRSLSRYAELANESTEKMKYQAIARWHLKEFQKFVNAADYLNQTDPDALIYRILLNIVVRELGAAEKLVGELRQCIIEKHDTHEFHKAIFGYDLEEVLECLKVNMKLLSSDVTETPKLQAQQDNLIESWKQRFARLPDDAELLFDHLCVESILLAGKALQRQWQRLFNIAIGHKKIPLAEAAMRFVTDFDKVDLVLLEARIEYAKGNLARAFQILGQFKDSAAACLQLGKWHLAESQLQKAQNAFLMALQKDVKSAEA
jgi:hypothetical protein